MMLHAPSTETPYYGVTIYNVEHFTHEIVDLIPKVIALPYNIEMHTLLLCRYDGDTFVKEVTADYVVWELHGRTDYTYNATSVQVQIRVLLTLLSTTG